MDIIYVAKCCYICMYKIKHHSCIQISTCMWSHLYKSVISVNPWGLSIHLHDLNTMTTTTVRGHSQHNLNIYTMTLYFNNDVTIRQRCHNLNHDIQNLNNDVTILAMTSQYQQWHHNLNNDIISINALVAIIYLERYTLP